MMFAYSFLAMTSYNIIQPLTRSKFISSLGAVNIPYVIFGAGLFIGVLMFAYTRLNSLLPRRWSLPIPLAAMAQSRSPSGRCSGPGPWADWVSVGFFVWGNLLGVLSSANSGPSPTASTIPGRQSGSSGSSGEASCSAA